MLWIYRVAISKKETTTGIEIGIVGIVKSAKIQI